jgi:hypothetical protein
MTLKDWNNRSHLKAEWKAFLKSETGSFLYQVLLNLGSPIPCLPPQGVDFIDWNATLNARREGYHEALRVLKLLAEDENEPTNLPEPWGTKTEETNQP